MLKLIFNLLIMRFIKFIFFPFLFFVIMQACKKDKKINSIIVQTITKDSLPPSESFVVNVVTDDMKALKYLNFINYSYFNGKNHDNLSNEKIGDTIRFTLDGINQSQIIELFSFGDSTYYNTRFFVSPNDTILMTIKKGKVDFSGKNAAHYDFFKELDSTNDQWSKNKYTNPSNYKKASDSIYNKRMQFFNDYVKVHPVSQSFKDQVAAELKFEYLYNLIAPRSEKSPIKGIYLNNLEGIYSVIESQGVKEEKIIDVKSYFNNLTINDFKRPELINNDYFKRSLIQYIRHYFTGHEYLNFSLQNFKKEIKYIEANLTGVLRDFAIAKAVTDYHKNGFGRSELSMAALNQVIARYKDGMTNATYVAALENIQSKLKSFKSDLPPIVLEDKLLSIEGDTLSLQQVLAANQNKLKVIDFWASWCKPCLAEIQKVKKFKEKLSNYNDVNWIYISLDHNLESWKSTSKKLQEFGLMENQYLILNRKESKILKILNINLIPRYMVLNKTNHIISENAPRPSDTLLFRKIIQNTN